MIKRAGESNIGVLIVFSVTVIIAAGVLWILSYFYIKNLSYKKYVTILWNIHSSLSDLKNIWICKTSTNAIIKYNVVNDTYFLECSDELGQNIWDIAQIETISSCNSSETTCTYKIRK